MDIENTNFLQPNGFFVTVSRLPHVTYWCNGVTLPGIRVSNPTQPNPFARIPVPGDTADFDSLTLEFNVDEGMKNWTEMMRWMVGFAFPRDFEQFDFGTLDPEGSLPGTKKNFYSDISVTVLSSHKNPIATFVFYNCVPTSLSGLDMTLVDSSIQTVRATATFDFSHFDVLKPATTETLTGVV